MDLQGKAIPTGEEGTQMSRPLPVRVLSKTFSRVNRKRQWYELPGVQLKALNLLSLRLDLRDKNLFDSPNREKKERTEEPPPEALKARRPDGRWNDLEDPDMGSVGRE